MKIAELFEDKWDDAKARYKANAKAKRVATQDERRAEKTKAGGELIDRVKKLPSYKAMAELADDRTAEWDLRKQILYFWGSAGDHVTDGYEFEISERSAKYKRVGSSSWTTIKADSLYKADDIEDHDLAGFDRSLQNAYKKLQMEIKILKSIRHGEDD
jgi:hypothetical protein